MSLFDEAREWVATVLILLVGLFVAFKFIEIFCKESSLFCSLVFGGGIVTAIVIGVLYFIQTKW